MTIEQKIKTLELISIMQKVEILMFKAKDATKRWGTPEGNSVAVEHLKRAEKVIESYKWPEELSEDVKTLSEYLVKYSQTLEDYELTYGSLYKTRLENAFLLLEKKVYATIYQ